MSYLYPERPDAYDNPSEFNVARELSVNLPATWHVISNVEWAKETRVGKRTGEIDFIVLAPDNVVHVIELTFGSLELNQDGDLVLSTPWKKKSKLGQLRSNKTFVIERLQNARRLDQTLPVCDIKSWLLAPRTKLDQSISSPLFEPSQVVDASYEHPVLELCKRLRGEEKRNLSPVHSAILRMFMRELRYYLDPTTLIQGERKYVSGLSEVAHILLSIESRSNRFVIDGVAGSGKTQIALAGLERARAKGLKAALISNTRVLPNLIQSEYGKEFPAHTFWSVQHLEDSSLDEIFIEEAHHFQPTAISSIERKLKAGGRIFYLMDSCQNFDGRFVPPEDSTTISLDTTYRVPQEVCSYLNLLVPLGKVIKCKSAQIESYISIDDSSMTPVECTVKGISSFLRFLRKRPELAEFCSVVYCGSQQELELMLDESRQLQELLREACELTTQAPFPRDDDKMARAMLDSLVLDSAERPFKFTVDTIRRFQGSSNKFVWVTGLHKQLSTESAVRLFYSAVTRSRARCEVFCTKTFAQQIAQSLG